MTVLNFRLNKFSGGRVDKDAKGIEVKANSTIVSVKREKDKRIGEYLHVNFRYDVEYTPGIGEVHLEGSLWFQHPKLDTIYSEVKGKVELKQDAVKEISNSVIRDSIIEALWFARKLGLPAPFQLPTVTVKGEKYTFPKAE